MPMRRRATSMPERSASSSSGDASEPCRSPCSRSRKSTRVTRTQTERRVVGPVKSPVLFALLVARLLARALCLGLFCGRRLGFGLLPLGLTCGWRWQDVLSRCGPRGDQPHHHADAKNDQFGFHDLVSHVRTPCPSSFHTSPTPYTESRPFSSAFLIDVGIGDGAHHQVSAHTSAHSLVTCVFPMVTSSSINEVSSHFFSRACPDLRTSVTHRRHASAFHLTCDTRKKLGLECNAHSRDVWYRVRLASSKPIARRMTHDTLFSQHRREGLREPTATTRLPG